MVSLQVAVAALATLGSAAAFQNNFILTQAAPLVHARMDPIMYPGKIDGHVHYVVGASNFRSKLNTPEEQLNAACSTTNIQADKSNYWVPLIYFINAQNEYEMMDSNSRIYYSVENTVPWPPGMRMISGLSNLHVPDAKAAQGFLFELNHETAQGWGNSRYLPNTTTQSQFHGRAGDNITAGITFPSCGWANQSLDSPDHFSHLAWPIDQGGHNVWLKHWQPNKCPPSHPIRYPAIFFEVSYAMNEKQKSEYRKNGEGPNFILANGDTSGLSYHGDFVNGWDPEVLQAAIDQCGHRQDGENPTNCPAFQAYNSHQISKPQVPNLQYTEPGPDNLACRYQGMLPAEPVGFMTPLKNLPGCNLPWNADKEKKPDGCPEGYVPPGWTPPVAAWNSHGGAKVLPVAEELPVDPDINTFIKTNTSGKDSVVYNWPPRDQQDQGKFGAHIVFTGSSGTSLNFDTIQNGTQMDLKDNKVFDTAKNKIDRVLGMKDDSEFMDLLPKTPPTTKYYTVENLETVSATFLAQLPPPALRQDPAYLSYMARVNPDEGNGAAGLDGDLPTPPITSEPSGTAAPTSSNGTAVTDSTGAAAPTGVSGSSGATPTSGSPPPTGSTSPGVSPTLPGSASPTDAPGGAEGLHAYPGESSSSVTSSDGSGGTPGSTGEPAPSVSGGSNPSGNGSGTGSGTGTGSAPATTSKGRNCKPKYRRSRAHM